VCVGGGRVRYLNKLDLLLYRYSLLVIVGTEIQRVFLPKKVWKCSMKRRPVYAVIAATVVAGAMLIGCSEDQATGPAAKTTADGAAIADTSVGGDSTLVDSVSLDKIVITFRAGVSDDEIEDFAQEAALFVINKGRTGIVVSFEINREIVSSDITAAEYAADLKSTYPTLILTADALRFGELGE